MNIQRCCSFQHVLDRVIGLVHYSDLGYKVVEVRPDAVVLKQWRKIVHPGRDTYQTYFLKYTSEVL